MSRLHRVQIVGGVPFPITDDQPTTRTCDAVDFDGGARELPPQPPRIIWVRCEDDRAWMAPEFVDRKW